MIRVEPIDGDYWGGTCMNGLAATCVHQNETSRAKGRVATLPASTDTRFRLLLAQIRDLLGHVSELNDLVEEIRFRPRTMHVDDFACVFTGQSVTDFHFALEMKGGRKVLMITSDIPMMARFVVGYLIRRYQRDPVLEAHL
jgi:hypothetical protein